jgi:hypothetical protein
METTTGAPEAGTVMSIITANRLAGGKMTGWGWSWAVLSSAERDWRALAGATGDEASLWLWERLSRTATEVLLLVWGTGRRINGYLILGFLNRSKLNGGGAKDEGATRLWNGTGWGVSGNGIQNGGWGPKINRI